MLILAEKYRSWVSQLLRQILLAACICLLPQQLLAHGLMQPNPNYQPVEEFPPIEEDIAALAQYGAGAQMAGKRLVERGESILPQAHATLSDPASPLPQKMQLITVLGEIADPSSADVIIEAAAASAGNRYLYQNSLLALTKFAPTDDIVEFADAQLQDEQREPLIQRSALAYFAQRPNQDAMQWVTKYSQPTASEDVRYAALYLGGVLGQTSVKDDIVQLLATTHNIARQYYLLVGLVEITDMEEFHRLTENLEFFNRNREKIERYLQFRKGDPEQRAALAKAMLDHGEPLEKRAAIAYLIEKKDAKALAQRWRYYDGFVRANVKRAGYEIEIDDKQGAIFREREHTHMDARIIASLLLLSLLVIWFGLRMRRS